MKLCHPKLSIKDYVARLNAGMDPNSTEGRAYLAKAGQSVNYRRLRIALWLFIVAFIAWALATVSYGAGRGDMAVAFCASMSLAFLFGTIPVMMFVMLSSVSEAFHWATPLADTKTGCADLVELANSLPAGFPLVTAVNRPLYYADLRHAEGLASRYKRDNEEAQRRDACVKAHALVRTATEME